MATPFNLTGGQAVTVSQTLSQNLWDALDVGNFDILDVELGVLAVSGTVNVEIDTSMQNSNDDTSWVKVTNLSWSTVTAGYQTVATQTAGFLRYIRWKVTTTGGSITFTIRGMGRRYGS